MQASDLYIMIESQICQARCLGRKPTQIRLGPDTYPVMRHDYDRMIEAKGLKFTEALLTGAETMKYADIPVARMRVPGVAITTARVIPVFKITKATPINPDSQP